ncbi:MAG TPA: hypothetical protein VGV60_05405 [Candidatus Polarisedimenticolia bacterium]|jgi:hypothetical protein|nr:hypothetical protein [Candidatus Polarisedimenticolia bacterium]
MMRHPRGRRGIGLVVLLAALGLPAAGRAHPPSVSSCEEAKRINGWCEPAHVGYVASVEIRSRFLYEVLDAHGHAIDPAKVKCETCRKALETDGYCRAHRMGYVHGEAFLSPLTYHLARARTIDPKTITCADCRKHTRGIGWCEKDQVGIAGYFAIDDRREFDELARDYELLLAAVKKSSECETCAGAMITDGYCAVHRLQYKDGAPITGP